MTAALGSAGGGRLQWPARPPRCPAMNPEVAFLIGAVMFAAGWAMGRAGYLDRRAE